MNKVIMTIGIPGSGKTTISKSFAEKNDYVYICPDDIRREITGNEADQSRNAEVWNKTYQRVLNAINSNLTVVIDATFANHKDRKSFLDFLHKSGVEKIQGLYIDIPIEISKYRNNNRQRKVPDYVLERMYSFLKTNPPSIDDGFDSFFILDENQKMVSAEMISGEKFIKKEFKIN